MQESRLWPDPENPDKQDGWSTTQCWQALLVIMYNAFEHIALLLSQETIGLGFVHIP